MRLEEYFTDLYQESDSIKRDILGEFEGRLNEFKIDLAAERESVSPLTSNKKLLQVTINEAIQEWASVGLNHHDNNEMKNKWISELRSESLHIFFYFVNRIYYSFLILFYYVSL